MKIVNESYAGMIDLDFTFKVRVEQPCFRGIVFFNKAAEGAGELWLIYGSVFHFDGEDGIFLIDNEVHFC